MPTGKIKFYDAFKEFGFIVPDDGSQDVYIHSKEVKEAGLDFLAQGQQVSYELKELRNRVIAHTIKLLIP